MARVQLALTVTDVDAATSFYERLFGVTAAKREPGYANFVVADPPLKLVLIEGPAGGALDHLGVEVQSAEEVAAAERRLAGLGLETTGVADTTCCYATKVETWVADPDGARWEWYVKTGDADRLAPAPVEEGVGTPCCG